MSRLRIYVDGKPDWLMQEPARAHTTHRSGELVTGEGQYARTLRLQREANARARDEKKAAT